MRTNETGGRSHRRGGRSGATTGDAGRTPGDKGDPRVDERARERSAEQRNITAPTPRDVRAGAEGADGPRGRSRAAEADEARQARRRGSTRDAGGGSAKRQAPGVGREEQREEHPGT
ncbi:hypothetical protein [Streptomyces sp. NPDC090025]|uniref:hypothetical protein n=1 Tax=Streptomyces sp. NPDC090025 TaxID=3365922 RepID=UPI00383741D0